VCVVALALCSVVLAAQAITGPSSSASPYMLRAAPGVVTKSILTVGDSVAGYRMVGVPDGLGAFDNGNGTFTVLMNHELQRTAGIQRAHGAAGAFVSKWIIRTADLAVIHGSDLIQNVATWNGATWNPPAKGVAIARLCSADLPAVSALFDDATQLGYAGRVLLNGEEVSPSQEGRAFANLMDGTSYELPALGKASWENLLARPDSGTRTIVIGLDDSSGTVAGQVYVYVGEKTASAHPVEAAGLSGGQLFGVQVSGFPGELKEPLVPDETPFSLYSLGDVSNVSGVAIEQASALAGVTAFLRPEDGAWDPSNPNDFYFVTTATFEGPSRLWRLRFADGTRPELGGTITAVLDGSEGQRMMDNMTIDGRGRIFMQEDPGLNDHPATVWQYTIDTDTLSAVARPDPARFDSGIAAPQDFLTNDEESSGIIDVSDILGAGWFLLDVQAPKNLGGELVAMGQLLAMHVPPGRR
jgi:hypothetical protein